MELLQRVQQNFTASIELKTQIFSTLTPAIVSAAKVIIESLKQQHKLLICGNGGSAEQSQHFSSELINRFEAERRALPAIALTADSSILTSIANDYAFENVFARQIEALGQQGDILFAISTSGNSANIIKAIEIAQQKNMHIISLTGRNGGKIRSQLLESDKEICVASNSTARIQEVHLLVIHCLCDLIDNHSSNFQR